MMLYCDTNNTIRCCVVFMVEHMCMTCDPLLNVDIYNVTPTEKQVYPQMLTDLGVKY